METQKLTLGELIRQKMSENGIRNIAELAKLTDLSHPYLSDLAYDRAKTRKGMYLPSPETLLKLSKALNCPIEEFLLALGLIKDIESARSDFHEIMGGVQIAFKEAHFNENERQEILEMIKVLVLGKLAERAKIKFEE